MTRQQQSRILVVDDDEGHRNMLGTVLTDWGRQVTLVPGVRACRERTFDLVLMDIRMPGKSGLEALAEIKAFAPTLPVVIMTAFSDIDSAVRAVKAGAHDYLAKPLDFEKLRVTLRNVSAFVSLQQENAVLKAGLAAGTGGSEIIGNSEAMRRTMEMVRTIAPSEATVLILGESGTGKELIARALHTLSGRRNGPYIAFNCAAVTESLMESELFGHEKGAFTGADKRRDGRFVQADKGTVFLDEIGEMPLLMQAKLLRVLQEREVQPVGGNAIIPVDVRIIAATNKGLAEEAQAGRFREDLYYRLNVVSLPLPPLRERKEDIPLLARHFLRVFAEKNGKNVRGLTSEALDALVRYSWPGNVRELENCMERAVVLLLGDFVGERELPIQIARCRSDVPPSAFPEMPSYTSLHMPSETPGGREGEPPSGQTRISVGSGAGEAVAEDAHPHNQDIPVTAETMGAAAILSSDVVTLKDMERATVMQALARTRGNKSEAAKQLGITRKTLHMKLQKYQEEDDWNRSTLKS